MRDLPVASELSKQVLEMRALRGELASPSFDNVHRRAYRITGYRNFICDVEDGTDAYNANPTVPAAFGSDVEGES